MKFALYGGGPNTTLDITGYDLDLSALTFDVTHTGSGGLRYRIGGTADVKGTISCGFDLDKPPYAHPPSISPGNAGVLQCYVGATVSPSIARGTLDGATFTPSKYVQIPVLIAKVHLAHAVESHLKWTFDVELAANYGDFEYPET